MKRKTASGTTNLLEGLKYLNISFYTFLKLLYKQIITFFAISEAPFTAQFLKQYLTEKQDGYSQSGGLREVVAYEKRSLGES